MKQDKVLYETGATSHAVNDLILFTDNTRELAELRDNIYKEWADGVPFIPSITDKTKSRFDKLFYAAADRYRKEFPTSHNHIITMTISEMEEFTILFAAEFTTWKLDHGYK
jgi:hypothetical protein